MGVCTCLPYQDGGLCPTCERDQEIFELKSKSGKQIVLGTGILEEITENCGHPPARIGEYLGCDCLSDSGVKFRNQSSIDIPESLRFKKVRLIAEIL